MDEPVDPDEPALDEPVSAGFDDELDAPPDAAPDEPPDFESVL